MAEVHHVVQGPADAPAVVLSNSLGTTLAVWDAQVPDLARHFRVIRYDLRGHGETALEPPPQSLADLGGDVLELLDRLAIPSAHLCGISLGGMVAMWVAAHAPERVRRLALCCTSPRFGTPERWFERAAKARAGGTSAIADLVIGRWFTPGFAERRGDVVARMRAMLEATPTEGYAAGCEVVATADLRRDLGSIQAPTLLVAGAEDPAIPAEDVEALATGIPHCRVEQVPAAHLANVEQPERVTARILEHLLATEEER